MLHKENSYNPHSILSGGSCTIMSTCVRDEKKHPEAKCVAQGHTAPKLGNQGFKLWPSDSTVHGLRKCMNHKGAFGQLGGEDVVYRTESEQTGPYGGQAGHVLFRHHSGPWAGV